MSARALHRLFIRIALAGVHVFAWIFVFEFFLARAGLADAFAGVVGAYGLSQIVALLATPFSARALRHGTRAVSFWAVIALSAAFIVLAYGYGGYLTDPALAVIGFAVLIGLYRALYWLPYEKMERSRPHAITELLVVLAPLCAGAILAVPGTGLALFGCAAALILVSIVPLEYLGHSVEAFPHSYRGSYHELFERNNRPVVLRSLLEGYEAGTLLLAWPLVLYLLFDGSLPVIGAVYAATLLLTLVVRYIGRGYLARATPIVRATISISSWIFRTTVAAPIAAVIIDVYAQSGSDPSTRGIDQFSLEQAADSHTYVDEFSTAKEMAQAIGRLLFAIVFTTAVTVLSVPAALLAVFVIAGCAAAAAILVPQKRTLLA